MDGIARLSRAMDERRPSEELQFDPESLGDGFDEAERRIRDAPLDPPDVGSPDADPSSESALGDIERQPSV